MRQCPINVSDVEPCLKYKVFVLYRCQFMYPFLGFCCFFTFFYILGFGCDFYFAGIKLFWLLDTNEMHFCFCLIGELVAEVNTRASFEFCRSKYTSFF